MNLHLTSSKSEPRVSGRTARTVVVTGATAGIGRAISERFARAGDRIGLIARDQDALEATRRELAGFGAEAEIASADVADAGTFFAAVEDLERKLGKIDIFVNDAMETVFSTVADMTPDEFRRVTEVTYLGFVYGTMAALKSMRLRRHGRIVQISSALAYRGIPLQSAYCGAKHAIRGFTDSVRTELKHERSRVSITMVDLPAVNTPQFDWARVHIDRQPRPMGRPIEPEVVAEAVYRAADGRWREYWLGWPTIETIIANTISPGLLDIYLARKAVAGQESDRPVEPGRRDNLDAPVPALHRTRGSFSAEAASGAVFLPAPIARAAVVAAGALVCFGLGLLATGLGRRGEV